MVELDNLAGKYYLCSSLLAGQHREMSMDRSGGYMNRKKLNCMARIESQVVLDYEKPRTASRKSWWGLMKRSHRVHAFGQT
jgi:hypothetical protein